MPNQEEKTPLHFWYTTLPFVFKIGQTSISFHFVQMVCISKQKKKFSQMVGNLNDSLLSILICLALKLLHFTHLFLSALLSNKRFCVLACG